MARPRVYFEIAFNGASMGQIIFELFTDIVPKTAENFKCLCTGEKGRGRSGKPLTFEGSSFHRIIPGFMCQGGDFTNGNGTGGESIYGSKFADENFRMKHTDAGILSMANSGPNTNGSQFFMCVKATPHLDGKHVVFGKVVENMELVRRMEACGSQSGKTSKKVTIKSCGIVGASTPAIDSSKRQRVEDVGGATVRVIHIIRKHKDSRRPSSWREKVITCTQTKAEQHVAKLREEIAACGDFESKQRLFSALAMEHSDCGSAKKGGDLGAFTRGRMQKAFEDASFALEVGQLSDIVSTDSGKHIILRLE